MSGLGGETFVQANQYQERLNQIAFGYPSLKRLGQQIRLQRTLRRPQLSDTLDEQLLNELLSDALPEIDGELLDAVLTPPRPDRGEPRPPRDAKTKRGGRTRVRGHLRELRPR